MSGGFGIGICIGIGRGIRVYYPLHRSRKCEYILIAHFPIHCAQRIRVITSGKFHFSDSETEKFTKIFNVDCVRRRRVLNINKKKSLSVNAASKTYTRRTAP